MIQWVPYGGPRRGLQRPHQDVRVGLPARHDRQGRRRLGHVHARLIAPITFPEADIRAVLSRPGVLADLSSAFDSPAKTVDDWVSVIARQTWLSEAAVGAYAGPGPIITDDRPRPEYFLLRRLFGYTGR